MPVGRGIQGTASSSGPTEFTCAAAPRTAAPHCAPSRLPPAASTGSPPGLGTCAASGRAALWCVAGSPGSRSAADASPRRSGAVVSAARPPRALPPRWCSPRLGVGSRARPGQLAYQLCRRLVKEEAGKENKSIQTLSTLLGFCCCCCCFLFSFIYLFCWPLIFSVFIFMIRILLEMVGCMICNNSNMLLAGRALTSILRTWWCSLCWRSGNRDWVFWVLILPMP